MWEPGQPEDALRLLRVVQDIALAREQDDVTRIVKRAARELSGADGVTFVLRDGDQCYYVDEDAISPLWKGKRFPATTCISGWAMIHRETVVIEDIYSDSRIPHDAYRPTFVKSLLMIPVRSRDPIAAIGAYWANPHKATVREVNVLQALADTTAVAIDNVQLIEALKRRAEESSRLLEEFKNEVAKREKAEEQLRQSQKMEAVGRLAGGVAHDFNNLLTAILGYTELALQTMSSVDPLRADIEEVYRAGERAQALTRQLLAFSRKQILRPQVLDLNGIVTGLDQLLRRVIGEHIDLLTTLTPDLDPVEVDPGQIEQIIMNLAINARDAMPDGGKLTIKTANVVLDDEYARLHSDARPGPHIMLAVSDSGVGMDAETRSRLFEPFYTTKSKGTGLGLATVYGIVKQSGGNVWIYSEPGHGATFKVYLPRAEKSEPAAIVEKRDPVTAKGTETILVVEDDESVRRLIERILEDGGYRVLATGDVDEAADLCTRHDAAIHLLLTDVVLPKSNGRELATKLGKLRPDILVLYMSGYTDDAIVHHGILEPDVAFIEKPLTAYTLLEKVRGVLSGAREEGGNRLAR